MVTRRHDPLIMPNDGAKGQRVGVFDGRVVGEWSDGKMTVRPRNASFRLERYSEIPSGRLHQLYKYGIHLTPGLAEVRSRLRS